MEKKVEKLHKAIRSITNNLNSIPKTEKDNFINYKLFPIELLQNADWNYKNNDDLMAEKLLNNIKRNGQIVTCQVRLLDSGYYEVIDGNHRLIAFRLLNQQYVIAYDHGIISNTEAKRLAIETNETKFQADDDKLSLILNELILEFPDLETTMPFSEDELNDLINISQPNFNEELSDINEDNFNGNIPDKAKTKIGDLYELNDHRILCGDSTNKNDVKILMNNNIADMVFTDPPYNVNYAEFNKKRRGGKGKDWTGEYCSAWEDSMSDTDYKTFLNKFIQNAKQNMIEYGHYYIWHATSYFRELLDVLENNNIPYDKVPLQWVKQVAPLSWVRYKRKSEPCLFAGKGAVNGNGKNARWFGPNNEINIWEISRDHNANYIHPTQKPVALAARAISNSSQNNEIVLDLFLGSGSTLIASDMLNRKCYGMELEPIFCDVIVKRFMNYCNDNNIQCNVKLNSQTIDLSYFDSINEE